MWFDNFILHCISDTAQTDPDAVGISDWRVSAEQCRKLHQNHALDIWEVALCCLKQVTVKKLLILE